MFLEECLTAGVAQFNVVRAGRQMKMPELTGQTGIAAIHVDQRVLRGRIDFHFTHGRPTVSVSVRIAPVAAPIRTPISGTVETKTAAYDHPAMTLRRCHWRQHE